MPAAFTQKEIKLIIDFIRKWPLSDKLTWDIICEASQSILGFKPTRQALSGKKEIANAYKVRRQEIAIDQREISSLPRPKSLSAAALQIHNLQKENKSLREELSMLAEAAEVFIHNASLRNIPYSELKKKPHKPPRQ